MINCSAIYCKKRLRVKRDKNITPFFDGQASLNTAVLSKYQAKSFVGKDFSKITEIC
jgi:hypothetical protein